MKRLLLDLYDVAGAVALTVWGLYALDVPADTQAWRVAVGLCLFWVAQRVVSRERDDTGKEVQP